jgi:ubiquinone/menaquinone biosynthesis C-methylase UbiE
MCFVRDTLRPRPGEHVLEVGCGAGIADLMLGLLEPGSVRYCGIDIKPARVREARGAARDHGLRLDLAVADVRGIPFRDATFECTFAIGVLQHVAGASHAVAELARVTRPDGRVLLVEPDNANRYWFSSLESGRCAFDLSTRFFAAIAKESIAKEMHERESDSKADRIDRSLGPHLFALGRDLIAAIDRYAEEGAAAGASFVEIQNTMLFALVGHRRA